MDIRLLEAADALAYTNLWTEALKTQDDFFRIAIEDESSPSIPTQFTVESFTLGAFLDHELIGTVSIARDERAILKHKALLFRMFVHASVAGRGVGRVLINQAITHAKSICGLNQIYLTVLDSNQRAKHLYVSLGFEVYANEPASVKIKNEFINELQMVYFLSERRMG